MKNLDDLILKTKGLQKKIVAVACAEDIDVLESIEDATREGIVDAILVGDEKRIKALISNNKLEIKNYEIIDTPEKEQAVKVCVDLVKEGRAHMIMKGLVDTKVVLKEVLKKENNLRREGVISHIAVFKNTFTNRLCILTDAAMNIAPNFEEKKHIIENAVWAMTKLGVKEPKVALLSAVEKVNEKIASSVEADKLKQEHKEGWLPNAHVDGPLALDNALSKSAALVKGINSPVAGDADILMVPFIEVGNVLYKSLTYISGQELAGAIVGAKVPIVLTSRSDSARSKLYSITLASLLS